MFSFAWPGRVNQEIWYACDSRGNKNISKIHCTSEHKDKQESKSKTPEKSDRDGISNLKTTTYLLIPMIAVSNLGDKSGE